MSTEDTVFAKAKTKYQERNIRERLLLLLALLALLYVILEASIGAWLTKQSKVAEQQLSQHRQAQIEVEAELAIFAASNLSRSNQEQETLIRHLQEKNLRLEEELGPLKQQVLSRNQFMNLLQRVAENDRGVNLLSLIELPRESEKAEQTQGKQKQAKVLDKYRLKLSLEGNYLSLAKFVGGLENSEWPIFWSSMDYRLVAYPKAVMELEIYSLAPNSSEVAALKNTMEVASLKAGE
ncbi:hypothetical protein [uncultured Pseudoteredinibacter sp.]|uniref:hypothetical protein n=1 Tax=uncultured Pseudoteredinibacter sp. TaxID=1641701 RepID=UPI00262389B9|nr:hypothetical protein [uncultured Pseudoteredinibacter sp.]